MATNSHNKSKQKSVNMTVNSHPPSFACPLTMEVMEDPVMDQCAHNFERKAVHEWLQAGHSCCPISRKPLTEADLVPNHRLAERIERWKWQREQGDIDWDEDNDVARTASYSDDDDDECSETIATATEADGIIHEDDEADAEMGHRKQLKRFARKKKRRVHYKAVLSADFMLLPQERHVLQMVRTKAEEADRKLWRQRCCTVFTSILVTLSLVLLGIGVARMVNHDDDEEN
jgi:U-box domain